MAHEIMIPSAENLPAYIVNPDVARKANEDAAANISTGFPPRIKMAGKTFTLVDGSGAETAIKNKEMVEGPDENMYLKTVVLRARKALQKVFYVSEYDPNADGGTPDCFSNDGERPDSSIKTPQCDVCAGCQQNAYGSARKGEGKACSDNKILAVFLPNRGVHQLKITPASLKNWGMYVKRLSAAGIPVGMVFTLVGFDQEATFPVLNFQYGGPLPEAAVPKLAAMAEAPEAEDIITSKITAKAPSAPAAKATPAPAKEVKATPAPAPAPPPEDDMFAAAPEQEVAKPAPVKQETPSAVDTLDADALAKELGL